MRRTIQFSKKVVVAMILLWFIVALFGMYMVFITRSGLEALFAFVGTPVASNILGYILKAAFENKEKIKQGGALDIARTNIGQPTPTQPDPIQCYPE